MSAADLNIRPHETHELSESATVAVSMESLGYPESAPRRSLRAMTTEPPPAQTAVHDLPTLWTARKLAAYLEVTTQTLFRERKRGRLRYILIGKKVRFTTEHIQAYLRNRECPVTSTNVPIARTGTSTTMMSDQEKQNALALARQISSSRKRGSPPTSSDERMRSRRATSALPT